MDLVIGRLELTEDEIDDIVAFMRTFTDDENWVSGRKKANELPGHPTCWS